MIAMAMDVGAFYENVIITFILVVIFFFLILVFLYMMYGKEEKGRCAGGGLGAISGHPVRCLTFGVAIFDDRGSKMAQTEVARSIPGGGGVIGWLK